MYERRAALALGRDPKFLGVPFAAEWIRQRGHSMKTTLDAIVGTVSMAGIQQEAEQVHLLQQPDRPPSVGHDLVLV